MKTRLMLFIIFLQMVSFTQAAQAGKASDFAYFYQMSSDMLNQLCQRFTYDADVAAQNTPGIKFRTLKRVRYTQYKPVMPVAIAPAPTVPAPVTLVFNSNSAWCSSKITVINKHTDFILQGLTTAPAEKWILKKDDSDKTEIASGALNDQYSFMDDVPGEFPKDLSLTIMVISAGNQYPVLVELH